MTRCLHYITHKTTNYDSVN